MSLETAVNNAVAELATTNTNMTAVLTEVQGQKDSLDQKVTQAGAAATSAQSAEAGAVAAQTASESARDASVTARDAAVVAQGAAEAARADTLSDVSAAEAERVLAENARSGAQSAEAGALAAQTGAETARSAVEAIESTIGVNIASAEASAAQAASAVSSVEVSRAATEAAETAASGHALSAGEHADRAETAEANAFAIADSDIASALTSYGLSTVKDVFVYDTSKDDDPDWIYKATWQSWYDAPRPSGSWLGVHADAAALIAAEPGRAEGDYWFDLSVMLLRTIGANASADFPVIYRGSKAQWPRRMVIVLYAHGSHGRLLMLDADDPELPAWAAITVAWNHDDGVVRALNGTIVVASQWTPTAAFSGNGLYVLPFASDGAFTKYRSRNLQTIAEPGGLWAAVGEGAGLGSGSVLYSRQISSGATWSKFFDVELWLDPLTRPDPVTGMRPPVVGAASDAGVVVVHEDGLTTQSGTTTSSGGVAFSEDGTLHGMFIDRIEVYPPALWRSDSFGFQVNMNNLPQNAGNDNSVLRSVAGWIGTESRTSKSLLLYKFGQSITQTRFARLTADWALPPSNLRELALAISSTDTADLEGSSAVTNGGFDTDTDWTKGTGWAITGGQAVATEVSGSDVLQQPIQNYPDGTALELGFDVASMTGSGLLRVYNDGTYDDVPLEVGTGVRGQIRLGDRAGNAYTNAIVVVPNSNPFSVEIDNIRCDVIAEDRSGNENGPISVGRMERRPLDGLGGVSTLQGFRVPQVNAGVYGLKATLPAIGTGDFCLSDVLFVPDGSYASFMGSESSPGVENFRAEIAADGNLRTSIGGVFEIHGPVPTDSPVAITLLRRSGIVEVWVNGFLLDSNANSTSLDWSVEPLWIVGHPSRGHSTDVVMGGLAHYETAAPTAEEVKEKHRVMLAWAKGDPTILSDTVDALDYDADTDELFVSGPSGTTVLHGSTLTRARTHTSADAHLSTNDHNAVAASGGVSAIASSSQVRLSLPALALRDRLLSTRSSHAVPPAVQRAATTDATPTPVSAIPIGEGEVRTFEITSRAHEAGDPTSSSEAAQYRCTFTARRPVGGDVELVGTPTVAVDYESTSSMNLSITANTADGLIEAVATGVAGTDLVWVTQLKEIAR